jgi:hypothetical protein
MKTIEDDLTASAVFRSSETNFVARTTRDGRTDILLESDDSLYLITRFNGSPDGVMVAEPEEAGAVLQEMTNGGAIDPLDADKERWEWVRDCAAEEIPHKEISLRDTRL